MGKEEYMRFCGNCGYDNRSNQKYCPNCGDSMLIHQKTDKPPQRWKIFVLIFIVVLFILIAALLTGQHKSNLNNSKLERINYSCIQIEEIDSVMISDTEGTATVLIRMPDYKVLFLNAWEKSNPERYINNALETGAYQVLEFEREVEITLENGKRILHAEDIVDQLLQELLIDAVKAVSEERK